MNLLTEYYDFSYSLLAKAVNFFKKYPYNPDCCLMISSIIE